ncbi:PhzF family phenazine biosynthesis protein [Halomonas caseinilytica]|uniref:PhzF family phenazine biosynthesis protein n=1 Tax=Halomonas caseinilytica TaxID=438744 RepID=UPI0007E57483|nr:PhzF family phenazine biosynthesis protein [Halomonas caseinilytica]SEM81482.1 trans-2,3-dihydro-3-hydroxyanthranilate isomerase [Halomonas caseinilytica]
MPSPLSRYYLLDVFTDTPLAGNPLAVFLDAEGMEASDMQAFANELNLAETVFVGAQQAENDFPIRIFTPSRELPFAGHPTIGTAHLLAAQGLVDTAQPLILRAPVGPLEVRFEGELARFTTAVPVEVGASSLGRAAAATLLGLEAPAIAGDPVQASCGLPFHLIPLDSEASLAKVMPDVGQWTLHVSPSGVDQVYLYVENGESLATRTFIREFAGLKEDPATGSAASALAGYLGTRDRLDDRQWRIRQGVDMGRPSEIIARARRDGEQVRVEVAGQACLVGEGAFYPRD